MTLMLQCVFWNPVVAADGHTYEESFIREYVKHHGTSPATQHAMDDNTLIPNVSVKQHVQQLQRNLQSLEADITSLC